MSTDHEEPCGPSHRSFCLNGGVCYVVPTMPSPFCRCTENYSGARCEQTFLPRSSLQPKPDPFAALVAVLIGTLIVGLLCLLCRKGHLQRDSSVQGGISLGETSRTGAPPRFLLSRPIPSLDKRKPSRSSKNVIISNQEDSESSVSIKI